MSQISFGQAEYAGKRKQTRRKVFLAEMEQVVPWKVLLKLPPSKCETSLTQPADRFPAEVLQWAVRR